MDKKRKAIIRELTMQRNEIKAASDDLRQPMSRMTSIISNMAEKENTVDGKRTDKLAAFPNAANHNENIGNADGT